MRAKPVTMFLANSGMISYRSPWSTICLMTAVISYGVLGSSGTRCSSAGQGRDAGSDAVLNGRVAGSLDCGRKSKSARTARKADTSSEKERCATPEVSVCVFAPPSSSWVTVSLVTVFTTSGPVTNMYDEFSTWEGRMGGGGGGRRG
jgi:hypothetical protein